MIAYIDNIEVKLPDARLKNPSFVQRRQDETGEKAFSFTGDIDFYGEDYDYLYAKLVSDPNAIKNEVVLKFVNDCCGTPQEYEFTITHESLKWCEGECKLTAAAIERSLTEKKMTCLKNTLIYDDYAGFKSKQHPRIAYCNELRPNWMHDVMILLALATATSLHVWIPLIASLVGIFNLINVVINWMNSNLGTSFGGVTLNGQTSIGIGDIQNYWNLLLSSIVGCGRKHPSPLVRDYANNVCTKCGLTFKSSIYTNPSSDYFNTVYFNAPVDKGTLATDNTTYWLDDNKPLRNGKQFFDEIKLPFNAEWRIVGNDLILERRDYFVPKTPFIDLTTSTLVRSVCWSWSRKTRYSYASFYYQKDGINWVGSEAVTRWGDTVEWNSPYSDLQKGEYLPLIPFAAARFRDDGIDRDVLSAYKNFPLIGPIIQQYDGAMLMNSHHCFTPMLLIWDGNSVSNAKVSGSNNYYAGFPGVGLNQFFNYPMWFNANFPNNLYDRFWAIEDPRTSSFKGKDFEAEFALTCELLDALDIEGQIITSEGISQKINQISINFATNTVVITGTV